jgi:hypothetical protein
MNRFPPLLLCIIAVAACKDPGLAGIPTCGAPCGTDIGECSVGYWACNDDGSIDHCANSISPSPEVCDGLDNDCDGEVDHFIDDCSTACGTGKQRCEAGEWSGCTAPKPKTEVCNGVDDDCNGKIDEPEQLTVEPCFSPDNPTYYYGECRPGITRCISGHIECIGEVRPSTELCDNRDNNCNNIVDEGVSEKVNVVVVMDESGSMVTSLPSIQAALDQAVGKYANNSDIKWMYVAIGSSTLPDPPPFVDRINKNFVDSTTFLATFHSRDLTGGNSNEASLDALYEMCTDDFPWEPGAKKVFVMFTDEAPQTYVYNVTPAMLSSACSGSVSRRYLFDDDYWNVHWTQYVPIFTNAPDDVRDPPGAMASRMVAIVDANICQ